HLSSHFSSAPPPHRHPPSFPTRRSSDLRCPTSTDAWTTSARISKVSVSSCPLWATTLSRSSICNPASASGRSRAWRSHKVCSTRDRKSTRLNSSHDQISYAVFCLKKKNI